MGNRIIVEVYEGTATVTASDMDVEVISIDWDGVRGEGYLYTVDALLTPEEQPATPGTVDARIEELRADLKREGVRA